MKFEKLNALKNLQSLTICCTTLLISIQTVYSQEQEFEKLILEGNKYLENKSYSIALTYYNSALRIDPKNADALIYKGIALYCIGDMQNALNSFNRVLQIDSTYVVAYQNRALILNSLGFKDAAATSEKIAERIIKEWSITEQQLFAAGEYLKASKYCKLLIKNNVLNAWSWNELGRCMQMIGDYEQAINNYDQSLRFAEDYGVLFNKATCYYHLKKYEKALKCIERVLMLNPQFEQGRSLKSNILKEFKSFNFAVSAPNRTYYQIPSTDYIEPAFPSNSLLFVWAIVLIFVFYIAQKTREIIFEHPNSRHFQEKMYTDYTERHTWKEDFVKRYFIFNLFFWNILFLFMYLSDHVVKMRWIYLFFSLLCVAYVVINVFEQKYYGRGGLTILSSTTRDIFYILLIQSLICLGIGVIIISSSGWSMTQYGWLARPPHVTDSERKGYLWIAKDFWPVLLFSLPSFILMRQITRKAKTLESQKEKLKERAEWFWTKYLETDDRNFLYNAYNCYKYADDNENLEKMQNEMGGKSPCNTEQLKEHEETLKDNPNHEMQIETNIESTQFKIDESKRELCVKTCSNCGAKGETIQFRECANGHFVCADCIIECQNCEKLICANCRTTCSKCHQIVCKRHIGNCYLCEAQECTNCLTKCSKCQRIACDSHSLVISACCIECGGIVGGGIVEGKNKISYDELTHI